MGFGQKNCISGCLLSQNAYKVGLKKCRRCKDPYLPKLKTTSDSFTSLLSLLSFFLSCYSFLSHVNLSSLVTKLWRNRFKFHISKIFVFKSNVKIILYRWKSTSWTGSGRRGRYKCATWRVIARDYAERGISPNFKLLITFTPSPRAVLTSFHFHPLTRPTNLRILAQMTGS